MRTLSRLAAGLLSRGSSAWLCAAVAPVLACTAAPPRSAQSEAAAPPGTTAEARAATAAHDCFTGGAAAQIHARVAIADGGTGQTVSLVDIAATGPRRDALRACYGAVLRELELASISRGALRPEVMRTCSEEPLGSPQLDAPAVLVDARQSDASTLLGMEQLVSDERFACNVDAFEQVQMASHRLSAYRSSSSCAHAKAKLQEAMIRATDEAKQTAMAWLDDAIAAQRESAGRACAPAADSAACRQEQEVERRLRQRREQLRASASGSATDIHLSCRQLP